MSLRNGTAPAQGVRGGRKSVGTDGAQHTRHLGREAIVGAPVHCTVCGHPLSAPKSVARQRGPVCATREGVHRG
ncbi:DUF6011 domain-containing protein [Rhodococcus aetherivorans]|uniref:DUF6011 domain-containing protein n=1 Tax=Rhodococcus aetherivorans TaxID=191292 RepID=UPI0034A0C754